jgi:hypothetical protein
MKTTIAVAALLASLGASAQAPPEPYQSAFESGNSLLSMAVNRSTDEAGFGKALFYVRGVTDATSGITHCAPGEVTNGQVLAMAVALIESTPSLRHRTAAACVNHVLREAFPCPGAAKPTGKPISKPGTKPT